MIYCDSDEEAGKVLGEVYRLEDSPTFSPDMLSVFGPCLSAKKVNVIAVKITSDYYTENNLERMFNN